MLLPLLSAIAFLAGVLVESFLDLTLPAWLGLLLVPLFVWRRGAALLLLMVMLGVMRTQQYEASIAPDAGLGFMELSGRVVAEIDRRQDHQKITVQTEQGRVLVKLSLYTEVAFGDEVKMRGELEEPRADIEGFNYAAYLARYRVALVMYDPFVEVTQRAAPSFRGLLYDFKGRMEARINRLFMEPEASFAAGLLLGSRKGMPEELAIAFQRVGLTHIIAISGYNISLVIAAMFLCFSFVRVKWRVILSCVAIFVFVLLVGASAAVVRAGIMGSLTLWALYTGRKSQVFFALLWSGLLMVVANPYILAYDVGFQLSFASTFGLLVFVPILEGWTQWWRRGLVLKEALLLTLAAQIATFPITAFEFGRLSLIAPLANVLAAPFIPFGMLFSALAVLLGEPLVLLSWFPLKMVEWIALGLAKLPYIDVPIQMGSTGYVLTWAVMLGGLFRFYKPTLVRAFVRSPVAEISRAFDPRFERHEKPPEFPS